MGGSRSPQTYYAKLQDERLLEFCQDCVDIMNKIEYKISDIDWRVFQSGRTYGLAYKKYNTVVLNQELVHEAEAAVKNTILHELAHIAAPAYAGHGIAWQQVCDKIRAATGQVITRTNPMSQHAGVAAYNESKIKYEFECPNCGSKVRLMKATRFVREYNLKNEWTGEPRWWCGNCRKKFGKKFAYRRIK